MIVSAIDKAQTFQPIILEQAGIASEFCCRFAKLSLGLIEQELRGVAALLVYRLFTFRNFFTY